VDERDEQRKRPSFIAALSSILLPVVLMLAKALADIIDPKSTAPWKVALDFLGTPVIALTAALLVGFLLLGVGGGMDRKALQTTLTASLPPIAGILLIVGAGGGFKQVLVDTGIGSVIADFAQSSGISVLLLAWLVAVLIRVATGSATVATVTAAGILAPLAAHLSTPMVALMVLAIGAGSVFLSHVNDAGFWLVKEFLGLSIPQTFKTWSVLECIVSVTGLAGVLIISIFVGG
jgi:GntP family gluconate:H+ symporter